MRKLSHDEIPRISPGNVARLTRHPVTVVLDNVRSLYNVGSIFRTADAALVERVVCTGITGTPEHRSVHKTALGAQDAVPWDYAPSPLAVVEALKEEGNTIAVLEITDTPTRPGDISPDAYPLALIVGNELAGVQDSLIAQADLAFEIPQYGTKQSLNVAVAFGIAVFELVRRYRVLSGLDEDP